eukprot:CAMPEP_0170452862 /NCGR_PEP_ID=MMETSP0123-20130129/1628_1 /TAXON_ID=182087 /ORGANISM="Favella ehrenbergii, Strain Fehren 1" /LENGTH=75 /DNA_ID=CAMNT_0010715027 /DNA_START=5157 /DNA_END=5384 /DNA_ORIENTATION=+
MIANLFGLQTQVFALRLEIQLASHQDEELSALEQHGNHVDRREKEYGANQDKAKSVAHEWGNQVAETEHEYGEEV